MTLEQLVTDLATSQRLRDAGFPQDTVFVWTSRCGEPPEILSSYYAENDDENGGGFMTLCAAPTAEEILKELPSTIEITEGSVTAHYIQYIYHAAAGWAVSYCSTVPPVGHQCFDLQPILATSAAHAYLWWKKEVAG